MRQNQIKSIIQVLFAALLFGASAPLSKLLLGDVEPIPLAAFLYLGSGLGLLGIKLIQRLNRTQIAQEAKIEKSDFGWLAGAIIAGGIAAPITLLFSLRSTPGATASLLLNFEGVATTFIAFVVFKEAISRRVWWAIGLVTLASIILSIDFQAAWGFSLGALGIVLACVFWGIDNNFTRNISAKDPLVIVIIKGLVSGSFSLILALILGNQIPAWDVILKMLALGSLSYGVSIVLFIHSLRSLGAARTSTLFSTAPIVGIILSMVIFSEMPTWLFFIAFPLMIWGAILLVNDDHVHDHIHESILHEHAHNHADGHHNHVHEDNLAKKHSHIHTHEELSHAHSHMPDIHHRHIHGLD